MKERERERDDCGGVMRTDLAAQASPQAARTTTYTPYAAQVARRIHHAASHDLAAQASSQAARTMTYTPYAAQVARRISHAASHDLAAQTSPLRIRGGLSVEVMQTDHAGGYRGAERLRGGVIMMWRGNTEHPILYIYIYI
jgi:hypothetical protein